MNSNNNITHFDQYQNNLKNDLEKLYSELAVVLNNIFKPTNDKIKAELLKKGIKTRERNLKFTDALFYLFKYSHLDTTKQGIVSELNNEIEKANNNVKNMIDDKNIKNIVINDAKTTHRVNYHAKSKLIPLNYVEELFNNVKNLTNINVIDKDKDRIIAVDGTYNNTNVKGSKMLETSLNMGYYDATNDIPLDLDFRGVEFKSKEIFCFLDYIKKNDIDKNKIVFVFDRAYYSDEHIKILNSNNMRYVIRIKNNSLMINNQNQIDKRFGENNNIRIISYEDNVIINVQDRNGKNVKVNENIKCNIITNLPLGQYKDDDVKKMYLQRWDVEVFFKLVKSNFKFANLNNNVKGNPSKTIETYKINNYLILIQIHIVRLLEQFKNKENEIKKKLNEEYVKNIKTKSEIITTNNLTSKINNVNDKKKSISKLYNTRSNIKFYDIEKSKNTTVKTVKTNKYEYNFKNNNGLMISGLMSLMKDMINATLKFNLLMSYSKHFIIKTNTIKNISNPRVSKTPFTKWYVRGYGEYCKLLNIIECLKTEDYSKLHINLRSVIKKYKLIIDDKTINKH